MNGFAARYADDGLVVLAIDVKEDEGAVAAFAEQPRRHVPARARQRRLGRRRAGTRWPCRSTSGSTRTAIVRDGALGGIGPDIMARGLRTILPGVDVNRDRGR